MSFFDMYDKQLSYEMRMMKAIEDEKELQMRRIISHLAKRFEGIENFEELKRATLSYLGKIVSGEIKLKGSTLIVLSEIEIVLSREIQKEENENG